MTAACAQMAQFYDLPGGSAAGMADSKLPDIQSGYEKGITNVMAGLSGLNLVYESAGMHASLLGFCLESLIIDNDMLGYCLRCVRGIEVSDAALSIDTITDVCINGPGHYLGNEQTLRLMQTEYFYPAVGDRFSPKEWNEKGKPDILSRAIAEKKRSWPSAFRAMFPRPGRPAARALRRPDQSAAKRHGAEAGGPPRPCSASWSMGASTTMMRLAIHRGGGCRTMRRWTSISVAMATAARIGSTAWA